MQPAAEGADSSAARRAARRAAQGGARWRKQARLERKADETLQKVQARHHPASDSDDECGGVEPAARSLHHVGATWGRRGGDVGATQPRRCAFISPEGSLNTIL